MTTFLALLDITLVTCQSLCYHGVANATGEEVMGMRYVQAAAETKTVLLPVQPGARTIRQR